MNQVLPLAPRIIIVTAILIAAVQILGYKGILITVGLAGLLLVALYFYQNKLLYMPGTSLFTKTFQVQLIHLKIIQLAIAIPTNIKLKPSMLKLQLLTM